LDGTGEKQGKGMKEESFYTFLWRGVIRMGGRLGWGTLEEMGRVHIFVKRSGK
jgi:hypothetical protein